MERRYGRRGDSQMVLIKPGDDSYFCAALCKFNLVGGSRLGFTVEVRPGFSAAAAAPHVHVIIL